MTDTGATEALARAHESATLDSAWDNWFDRFSASAQFRRNAHANAARVMIETLAAQGWRLVRVGAEYEIRQRPIHSVTAEAADREAAGKSVGEPSVRLQGDSAAADPDEVRPIRNWSSFGMDSGFAGFYHQHIPECDPDCVLNVVRDSWKIEELPIHSVTAEAADREAAGRGAEPKAPSAAADLDVEALAAALQALCDGPRRIQVVENDVEGMGSLVWPDEYAALLAAAYAAAREAAK